MFLVAEENDFLKIAQIEKDIFSDPWSVGAISDAVANGNYLILKATDGEDVVGYLNASVVAGEANINRIAVKETHRRRNIAETLLKTAEEILSGRAAVYFLEVRESNLPAIKLYEKLGYKTDGIRKNFYSAPTENAVLMSKEMKE